MENQLVQLYVKLLQEYINRIAKKYCNGCHLDNASQLQHDKCFQMDWEERVDTFFEEAFILLVCENKDLCTTNKKLKTKILLQLKQIYNEVPSASFHDDQKEKKPRWERHALFN